MGSEGTNSDVPVGAVMVAAEPVGEISDGTWLWPIAGVSGTTLLLVLVFAVWALTRGPRGPGSARDLSEVAAEVEREAAKAAVERQGLLSTLREALGKSRSALAGRFDALLGRGPVDSGVMDGLEEALLGSDVGMSTVQRILEPLKAMVEAGRPAEELRAALKKEIKELLTGIDYSSKAAETKPWIILIVGVNGSGKTTSIGKLSARLVGEGRKVLIAAGDTYRAAASDQLKIWAERAGADFVSQGEGADPGAVVYDALEAAKARGMDVVIIDTAGRLQTQKPLMDQLSKVRRVIQKQFPEGPHETLLVLDGTMGQNGLSQARLFHEATPLTGAIVTKLDGTAKGGMVLTLVSEMALPVRWIGVGEKVSDLRPFDPELFAEAIA